MTRDQYARVTGMTRRVVSKLPFKERCLVFPTVLTAAAYIAALVYLFCVRDPRLLQVILIPAVCFGTVTVLRNIIGRERPYDAFGLPPVGKWNPGKRKSLPSRHAASAAAIALAAAYAFPVPAIVIPMMMLSLFIAALRVLSGHHYPSDVVCALILSGVISWVGYCVI